MLDRLISEMDHLGPWGYLVVFVVIFLECQALVGLVMPGESLIMFAGFLAAQDLFCLWRLIVVIALAAVMGDTLSFEFGRRLGRNWLLKHGHRVHLTGARLEAVETFFAAHGGKAVLGGHFMHIMRALMPFVAGTSRMSYPRFLIYNCVGCAVWTTIFTLIGYFVGASWALVTHWIGTVSAIAGGLLALLALGFWLWRRRRRRAASLV